MDELEEGLVLDAESHRYFYRREPVGGVTEIVQALGIVEPRWFTDYARERGTAVHLAIQYLIEDRLDWSTLDPRIVGYVRAAERFMSDAGIRGPCMVEYLVHHPALRYAGRLDLFAQVFGQGAVIDFKSGGLGCANIQTAAYEEALRIETGAVVPYRRMAVQLRANGTYRKEDYRSAQDYTLWHACCLIFNTYHLGRKAKDHVE